MAAGNVAEEVKLERSTAPSLTRLRVGPASRRKFAVQYHVVGDAHYLKEVEGSMKCQERHHVVDQLSARNLPFIQEQQLEVLLHKRDLLGAQERKSCHVVIFL